MRSLASLVESARRSALHALDAATAAGAAPPTAPWSARDDACLARFLDANQVRALIRVQYKHEPIIDRLIELNTRTILSILSRVEVDFKRVCDRLSLKLYFPLVLYIAVLTLFIAQDGKAQIAYC